MSLNLISFHLNIVVLKICIISNLFPIQIQFQIDFLQRKHKFSCFFGVGLCVFVCVSVCWQNRQGKTGILPVDTCCASAARSPTSGRVVTGPLQSSLMRDFSALHVAVTVRLNTALRGDHGHERAVEIPRGNDGQPVLAEELSPSTLEVGSILWLLGAAHDVREQGCACFFLRAFSRNHSNRPTLPTCVPHLMATLSRKRRVFLLSSSLPHAFCRNRIHKLWCEIRGHGFFLGRWRASKHFATLLVSSPRSTFLGRFLFVFDGESKFQPDSFPGKLGA